MENYGSYLMTFDEYALGHPYKIPHTFGLRGNGNSALICVGMRHTNDSGLVTFSEIEKGVSVFDPDVIAVEGRAQRFFDPKSDYAREFVLKERNDVIRTGGEPDFGVWLAMKGKIVAISPEPTFKDEVSGLVASGFSRDSIFAYYAFRGIVQYNRLILSNLSLPPVDKYIRPYIKELRRVSGWNDFDFSFDNVIRVGDMFWGNNGDPRKPYSEGLLKEREDPVKWPDRQLPWTEVNEVSQMSTIIRDRSIVSGVISWLEKGKRVLEIFGSTHVIMQEPAYRKYFLDKGGSSEIEIASLLE